MEFQFHGVTIIIDEGKKTYLCMLKDFLDGLHNANNSFERNYNQLKNLENLVNNYWDLIDQVEIDGYKMVNSILSKYGKVSVPSEAFREFSMEYSEPLFVPFLQELVQKYDEITDQKERKFQAREQRKANRRQWYGWTREGQNQADIKNMQSLLWHNTRNMVGNTVTSGIAGVKMSAVFRDQQRINRMKESIEDLYKEYWKLAFQIMVEKSDVPIRFISKEEKMESDEFLEKAETSEKGGNENIHAIKTALEIYPGNRKVYEYMIENFGDSDCEIEKLAYEFRVDMSAWKDLKIEELLEHDKTNDWSSERKLLDAIHTAEEYCKHYGVSSEKYTYINELKRAWNTMDKGLRTVEGVEYSSREEADKIKQDLRFLEAYSLGHTLLSSDLSEAQEELLSMLKTEEVKSNIKERLLKYQENQDLKNIQKASMEIISSMPIYEKIQKCFLFGHIFSLKKGFERLKELFADNKKIAFVYDPAWLNKGKNGLLLTNTSIYYYTEKDIIAIGLEEFRGIEISQEKIIIHRNKDEDVRTDLVVKIDQLEYWLFCETFERVITMCRSIKNKDQIILDEEVYDNFIKKDTTGKLPYKTKVFILPVIAAIALLLMVINLSSNRREATQVESEQAVEVVRQAEADERDEEGVKNENSEEKEAMMFTLDATELVELVKTSIPVSFSEMATYGETFESFFSNPIWTVQPDEFGNNRVAFRGECLLEDEDVLVTVYFDYDSEMDMVNISKFWIDSTEYTSDDVEELLQVIYDAYNAESGESLDDEVEKDYAMWIDTYQRTNGPAATIFVWDANEEGIWFAAGIGASGPAAYIDMRDKYAVWEDENVAVCTDDSGYRLIMTMQSDGSIVIDENQEYYEGALSLNGVYNREEEADLSVCEYVFPDSNEKLLDFEDYAGMSKLECKIARNEIYARHGRKFDDEFLQAYFDVCTWYNGFIEPEEFTENMLNEIELTNLQKINEYEIDMGYKE